MQKIIKSETKEKNIWIASDGREFDYESQCKHYEERCLAKERIKDIPHKTASFNNSDEYYNWYYIATGEDAIVLKNYLQEGSTLCDQKMTIGDWNGFRIIYDNNSMDYYDIVSLTGLIKEYESDLNTLKSILE